MTISMQTNLSAGYMPSGAESKPLDPTSQKVVEKAGVLPESASNYVGAEINGTQSGHHTALLKTLLPEPGNDRPVGDPLGELTEAEVAVDIYSVMMLFQQCAQQMRNQAREVRNSEMQSQVAQLKGAAKEIRKAAQERLTQAMIQGWLQIGGGSLSAGMGAVGALGGMTSLKLGPKTFWGGMAKVAGGGLSGMAQPTGTITSGIGGVAGAGHERAAAGHDARKAEREAQARVHEQNMQQANDTMQQMMEVIRDVREKLAAIDQGRIETVRNISRNV